MSKSVISYCGKFDLLYAVTVKAVGLEAEMEMRQKIGEVVDRLEPLINSIEKPGRVVVYVCTAHEAERTLKHTPFFKQSGAAVTHKTIIATVWTMPSKREYDEFEAHCDLTDDMVVVWEHQAPVTLEIKFNDSMRSVTKDIFLKPFPTSRDAQALDAAVSKWFMDSLKVDPKIMMGGFPRFRNLGGAVPNNADLFRGRANTYPGKFVYKGQDIGKPSSPIAPDVDSTPAIEYDGYYHVAQRNGKRAKCKRTGEVFLTHKPSVNPGVNYIFPLERRTPDWYETVSNDIFETKYEAL